MPRSGVRRPVSWPLWVIPILLLASGCAEEEWPEVYPVRGKVVYEDGKPLTKGFVTFVSVEDYNVQATGKIQKDGTFTLDTVAHTEDAQSKYFEGSTAGEFKVSIWPYPGGPGGGMGEYTLKKTYTVNPTENNEITVLMEPVVR